MSADSRLSAAGPGLPLLEGGFPALTDRPDLYPGIPETLDSPGEVAPWPQNYLLHDDALWQLLPRGALPLGHAGVKPFAVHRPSVEPRPPGSGSLAPALTLDAALAAVGAAGLPSRLPVIAIGSNAYPRQLADKLRNTDAGMTVPSFRGALRNVSIVYCPRKARKGYVPVTPSYERGPRALAWLQLLTPAQLEVVVSTEGTYRLLRCRARREEDVSFTVVGASAPLPECLIFWYATAFRRSGHARPPVCRGTELQPPATGRTVAFSQRELWTSLGPLGPNSPEVERGSVPNQPPPNSSPEG